MCPLVGLTIDNCIRNEVNENGKLGRVIEVRAPARNGAVGPGGRCQRGRWRCVTPCL